MSCIDKPDIMASVTTQGTAHYAFHEAPSRKKRMRLFQALGPLEASHCGNKISRHHLSSSRGVYLAIIHRRNTVAECTSQVTRSLKGRARNGIFHNRSTYSLGLINERECDTAIGVRLVQYLCLPLSPKRRVMMVIRRHCGGAFAKSQDLHDYPLLLAQNTQIHSHCDDLDQKVFGLSYITRRLCSLDSSPCTHYEHI